MTKYLIAILGFLVALMLLLFWVGGDVFLTLESSATSGLLAFGEVEFSWQAVILATVVGTLALIGLWEALLAGAEGDVKKARKKAEVARNLIGSTELGRVISALSAEASGDRDIAVEHYEAMLENDKTRATGQRGLAQNMLATGDLPGAIEQSREAYIANPEARWAFDTLFKAEVANHRFIKSKGTRKRRRN